MRLDKLLSRNTGLSRSQAREAIKAGRVSAGGRVLLSADAQMEDGAALYLDGRALSVKTEWHLMLNKPAGLLTAARDSRAGTIMDLLPEQARKMKCMPVGRLDKDTEGLLLLTTDGELAHRLLAPKRGITKVYQARVEGRLGPRDAEAFQNGIALSDFTALPAELDILEAGDRESLAMASVKEGKFHQVRRMFGSLGHEVLALKRLRFGPILLDENLATGQYRELDADELEALKEAVGLV